MRTVVLTSETPGNIWLVNQLLSRHDIAAIVIERRPLASSGSAKVDRWRRMARRHGVWRTFNKLLYNRVRSWRRSTASAMTAAGSLFPADLSTTYVRPVPTLVAASINDGDCRDFIRRHAPDLLAVCGTSVLKPETFTLAPHGAINIHTGITPEYRSADPIFWALYRGEPEKVGVTIHYVDRGIDTGSIVHQEAVPVYADDSLETISARCIRRGAELYSQAILDIERGTARTIDRSGATSRAYLSIDLGLVQYVLFRWRFRRLASRLPRRNAVAGQTSPQVVR